MPHVTAGLDQEEQPLLIGTPPALRPLHIPDAPAEKRSWCGLSRRHVPYMMFLFIFVIEIGDYVFRAPWQRMVESILCRDYYLVKDPTKVVNGVVEERFCKVPGIQRDFGDLIGWDVTLNYMPGLFLAVPYARLADRWGRRPVLFLIVLGATLALINSLLIARFSEYISIFWILASNVFLLIGGGSSVAASTIATVLIDTTEPEERTRAFMYMTSSALIAITVTTPIAAELMKINLWIPLLAALGLMVFILFAVLLIPETSPKIISLTPLPSATVERGERQPLLAPPPPPESDILAEKEPWWHSFVPTYFATCSPAVKLLSISFMAQSFARQAMPFLLPMVSRRFEWSISEASYLLPVTSITTLVVLLIILPLITKLLTGSYFKKTPAASDLIIARTSITILTVGALAIALAPIPALMFVSVIVYSCGAGFAAANRSVIAALTPPVDIAQLFGSVAIFDTLGGIASGYTLATTFDEGISRGGLWTGLPFMVAAGIFAFVAIILALIRLPDTEKATDDAEE